MAKRLNYEIGFTADTKQLETAINGANAALAKLYNQPGHLSSDLEMAAKAAQDLSVKLNAAYNSSTGHLDLVAFNKSLETSKRGLDEYIVALVGAGESGQQAFIKVAQAIATAEVPIKRTNALLGELWTTMKNTMRWQLTSSMLHGFMSAISTAYGYTKDLNESLNSIRIVTQKSADDMARFANEANKAAKALSTTTTRYTDASLIYYQQGLDDETVKARTDVTIKLANAAGESAETASEQLTAIWNNFAKGSEDLEHYADVLTALGASTASSTAEISQGLEKFAAIADTVGLSYEYAASALATVTATTRQSADVVGTSFRTLFGRIESLKLGETLDDGTTLNKYSQALESVGVSIKNANGELKDMDNILDETMAKWQTLTRDQQVALAQTVAGVRQYAQFIALMDNADFFQRNLETARKSEGTLQEQANIYAESWEAARDRVRAAAEDIYDSFINEQDFISVDNVLESILSRIADLIDAAGGFKGILTMIAPAMLSAFGPQIVKSTQNWVYNLQQGLGLNQAMAQTLRNKMLRELEDSKQILVENENLKNVATVQNELTKTYVDLQEAILNNSDKLNEDTIKQTKALLEQIKVVQELSNKYLEVARNSYNKGSSTANSFLARSNGDFNEEFVTDFTKQKSGRFAGNGMQRSAVRRMLGLPSNYNSNDLANSFRFDNHTQVAKQTFYDSYYGQNGLYKLTQNRNNLIKQINSGKKEGQDLENLKQQLKDLDEQIKTTEQDAKALGNALSNAYPNLANDVEEIEGAFDSFNENSRQAMETGTRPAEDIMEYSKAIQKSIETNDKWSTTITRVGSGLSALAMGITSVTSLIRVLNDDSLSTAEKTTQILFSVGMIIPMVSQALNAVRGSLIKSTVAQGVYNAIMKKGTVEESQSIFVKRALAVAEKYKTEATWEGVTATEAANITTKAYLISLLPYIAIAAAVALAIYGMVKAYNADAEAAKAAAKAHEEAAKSAREVQQNYNDFLDLAKSYNEAIEKTKELTKGTEEYSDVLSQANQQAEQLLEKYEKFNIQSYYKNGVLQIKEGELERVQSALINQSIAANTRSSITSIQATRAQETADRTTLERSLKGEFGRFTDTAIDYLLTNQINKEDQDAIQDLDWEFEEAYKWFETASGEVAKFADTIAENNKKIQESLTEFAAAFTENLNGFDQLTEKEQEFVNRVIGINVGEEEFNQARAQIRNRYVSAGRIRNDGSIETIWDRDALLKDYQSLGGTEEKLSNEELLQYIQDLTAEGVAIGLQESLVENLETFFKNDSELAGVIETWVNNGMEKIDFSEVSPALKKQLEQSGLKLDDLLGEGATNNFSNQLKDYNVQDWIDAQVAGANLLISKYQEAEVVVSEALGKIAEGTEELSEEDIQKLKDALAPVEGVDLTGFEGEARKEQIEDLKEILKLLKDEDTVTNTLTATLKENAEAYEDDIVAYNRFTTAIDKVKEALKALTKNPWEVKIDGLNLDARTIAAEVGNIKKVIASIGDDLTIDSDAITEIGERYPDILEDIEYRANENILKINEDRYNKLKEYYDGDLEHYRDEAAQKLLEDAQNEQRAIKIIDLAEGVKQGLYQGTVEEVLKQNGIQEEDIKATSKRIVLQTIDDEIEKLKAAQETYLTTGSYNEATEKTITKSLQTIEGNTNIAATNMQGYFIDALRNTSKAYVSWVNNPEGFATAQLKTSLSKATSQQYRTTQVVSADSVRRERENSAEYKALQGQIATLQSFRESIGRDGKIDPAILARALQTGGITQGQYDTLNKYNHEDYAGSIQSAAEANLTTSTKTAAQKARQEFLDVLDDLLGDLSKSSKSGSGSGANKLSDKDVERYHEITREIQKQSELLDKLSTQADDAYGVAKLDIFRHSLEELENQHLNYLKKAAEADAYLESDRADLDSVNNAFGLGLNFNNAGEISNYTSQMRALADRYVSGEISDEDYSKIESIIKRYEESLDTRRENMKLAHDIIRQIQETHLNEINYKLELAIDIKDVRKQINDITSKIAESYGDAITHIPTVAGLQLSNALEEIELFQKYQETAEELNAMTDDWSTNTEDLVDAHKDLISKLEGSIDALLEWMNYWENMLPEAINAASERLGFFTNQLSHNTTILETINELYTLQGQTYKTAEGFRRLQQTSQEHLNSQLTTAVLNKNWFNELKTNLANAQAALDSLNGDENDIRWDAFKANRDALLAEYNEAEEAYLSSAKEAMESAKQMYERELEKAAHDFAQAIAGGDLEFLTEKYDHFIDQEERYLDAVNAAYEKQVWYNRIQRDIDNDTNQIYKNRLELFYQQEVEQRALNGLNKYDLDIIEAKYKVLQAQMALEEAQNNATSMRLTRNSQGNWTYRFGADPDAIADAEQQLADANNDWYNIAKTQVKDVTGEIISAWEEAQKAIQDIYNDMTLTDEERAAKVAEIYQYYIQKIEDLEREKQIAIADMTEAGQQTITDFSNTYAETLAGMSSSNQDFASALTEYIQTCQYNFEDLNTTIETIADESETSLGELDQTVNAVTDSTQALKDVGNELIKEMGSSITTINNNAIAWGNLAIKVEEAYQAMRELAQLQGVKVEEVANRKPYREGVDYSAEMRTLYLKDGAAAFASQEYQQLERERNAKIQYEGLDTSTILTNEYIRKMLEAGYTGQYFTWEEFRKLFPPDRYPEFYATGGYTGAWGPNGKLAFLHEKELVLNKEDTENILAATEVMRAISQGLDGNAITAMGSMAQRLLGVTNLAAANTNSSATNYFNVSFPNAVYASEIEQALNNLIANAEQYANDGGV